MFQISTQTLRFKAIVNFVTVPHWPMSHVTVINYTLLENKNSWSLGHKIEASKIN